MKKMMSIFAVPFVALAFSTAASATCFGTGSFQNCYDSNTGNSYNVQRYGNTTQMNGYNASTGSNWNQTSQTFGNTTYHRGTASNGNSWNSTQQQIGVLPSTAEQIPEATASTVLNRSTSVPANPSRLQLGPFFVWMTKDDLR